MAKRRNMCIGHAKQEVVIVSDGLRFCFRLYKAYGKRTKRVQIDEII